MRVHPSKRAFVRRFPAPPPTPDGMVFYAGHYRRAEEVQRQAARVMGMRDAKVEAQIRLCNRANNG